MKAVVEDLGGSQKKLVFDIPPEEVKEEMDKYCKKLAKEVDVKGFRKGKAPASLIRRYFKQQIHGEVASQIVSSSLEKALKEHSLTPLGEPEIDTPPLEEGKGFPFTVTLDVKPEVDVKDYKEIQLDTEPLEVEEEEINKSLDELRKAHAELKDIEEDRGAVNEEVVLVDYQGYLEGAPLPGDEKKDVYIEIGSGNHKKEVEDALIGALVGDTREVDVDYPANFLNKEIAGKTVQYRFHVKKILKKILPELDDEFAKDVGTYENLEALKERLTQEILNEKKIRLRKRLEEELLDKILENNTFDAPRALVKSRRDQMIMDARSHFLSRGVTLEQDSEDFQKLEAEFDTLADKEVKKHLLLEAIAKKESIQVSDADMEEEINKIAGRHNQTVEKVKADIQKQEDGMERFRQNQLITRTLDFLLPPDTIKEGEKNGSKKDKAADK